MKPDVNTKISTGNITLLYICFVVVALYIAYTFPLNLILNIFWDKVDQTVIEEEEEYGDFAGLPAGDGVAELTDIDQFYGLQKWGLVDRSYEERMSGAPEIFIEHPDYITFETDSIIPLGLYRLNSQKLDGHRSGYWNGGHYISSRGSNSEFTESRFWGSFFYYNQYYLVRLPDGNYVPALLDDAYYVKWRLAGRVQLPLGVADRIRNEQSRLKPYLDEYGVSDERMLDMYCEKRYDDWALLYGGFALLLWYTLSGIGFCIRESIIKRLRKGQAGADGSHGK